MRRAKVKHLRERLALWVAPWLLRPGGIRFGPDATAVSLYRTSANTFPTDAGIRIGSRNWGK